MSENSRWKVLDILISLQGALGQVFVVYVLYAYYTPMKLWVLK